MRRKPSSASESPKSETQREGDYPAATCPRCGAPRQTRDFAGNPEQFHCGSTDRWQSSDCEHRREIVEIEAERDAARDRARLAEQRERGNLEAYWKTVGALRDLHDAIASRMSADDPSPEDRTALWEAWKQAGQMLPENA